MAVDIKSVKEINSIGFNEAKTEELIANLKKDGTIVGLEDLSKYIRTQGLIVKVHVGRKRNYIEVPHKLFGIDVAKHGIELQEFFKQHIKMGRMSFIPDSDDKVLMNIESSVRMARTRCTIGYDDSFMTLATYDEFVKMFDERKEEYFDKRNDILERWDMLIADFKRRLAISLDELNSLDKEKLFQNIISRLPSKEEYSNSFYMRITAKAFPVTENLDMFSEDIQSQIKDGLTQETIETLYEVIGNTLNDAFQNVNKIILSAQKNEKVAPKTLGAVTEAVRRIGQKNIFHNDKIDEIKSEMDEMLKLSHSTDAMTEKAEGILAKIYGYANELGIETSIKLSESAMSAEELLSIFEMLESISFDSEDVSEPVYKMLA